jgi:hypothetical protein
MAVTLTVTHLAPGVLPSCRFQIPP